MFFEKNEKKFSEKCSRQNRNIPRTAESPKFVFHNSFLKLNSLQAHIKKIKVLTNKDTSLNRSSEA